MAREGARAPHDVIEATAELAAEASQARLDRRHQVMYSASKGSQSARHDTAGAGATSSTSAARRRQLQVSGGSASTNTAGSAHSSGHQHPKLVQPLGVGAHGATGSPRAAASDRDSVVVTDPAAVPRGASIGLKLPSLQASAEPSSVRGHLVGGSAVDVAEPTAGPNTDRGGRTVNGAGATLQTPWDIAAQATAPKRFDADDDEASTAPSSVRVPPLAAAVTPRLPMLGVPEHQVVSPRPRLAPVDLPSGRFGAGAVIVAEHGGIPNSARLAPILGAGVAEESGPLTLPDCVGAPGPSGSAGGGVAARLAPLRTAITTSATPTSSGGSGASAAAAQAHQALLLPSFGPSGSGHSTALPFGQQSGVDGWNAVSGIGNETPASTNAGTASRGAASSRLKPLMDASVASSSPMGSIVSTGNPATFPARAGGIGLVVPLRSARKDAAAAPKAAASSAQAATTGTKNKSQLHPIPHTIGQSSVLAPPAHGSALLGVAIPALHGTGEGMRGLVSASAADAAGASSGPPSAAAGRDSGSATAPVVLLGVSGGFQGYTGVPASTPAQVIQHHRDVLSSYEVGEILEFKTVYFAGDGKVAKAKANSRKENNHGFDDARGEYQVSEGDHILYRYEVVGRLGAGSFGQVLRCVDHKTGRAVAVKVVRNRKRFHKQARVEVALLERIRDADADGTACVIHLEQSFIFRAHMCIVFPILSINLYELSKLDCLHACLEPCFAGSCGPVCAVACWFVLGLHSQLSSDVPVPCSFRRVASLRS